MKGVTKITAFYYLHYPDNEPDDPENAASEVYVEVGDDNSTVDKFLYTYAFNVYTLKYVNEHFLKTGRLFFVNRSMIIVKRFTDEIIKKTIEEILPNIEEYGIDKG